jgi:hypothetical protein
MIQTQAIRLGDHNSAKFSKPKTKYGRRDKMTDFEILLQLKEQYCSRII